VRTELAVDRCEKLWLFFLDVELDYNSRRVLVTLFPQFLVDAFVMIVGRSGSGTNRRNRSGQRHAPLRGNWELLPVSPRGVPKWV